MKLTLRTIVQFSDDKSLSMGIVDGLPKKTWINYLARGKYVIRVEGESHAREERCFESPEAALAELQRTTSD
jgi:hypothetical protein